MLLCSGITISMGVFSEYRSCANSIGEIVSVKGFMELFLMKTRAINASGLIYNAPEKGY
jgi:hypothetical protein